ncbi:MAG: thiamine phosphate synthase [Deltaproteobacteria bacterium]|nr:thiamine phosphate synthase [Deltaproteobacteria bacterium]
MKSSNFVSTVPRLIVIVPYMGHEETKSIAGRLIGAGCPGILFMAPDLSGGPMLELAGYMVERALETRTRIFVSDRADVASLAGAMGVHLPSSGLEPGDARLVFKERVLIGVSCHSVEDIERAENNGADYASLSPVFRTTSHPERKPLGLGLLARAVSSVGIPVMALGGITIDNIEQVLLTGVHGVAVLSHVVHSPDPVERLGLLLENMRKVHKQQ